MKIAVIGAGIAGNVAAYRLAREHEVTVFEAARRVGGHTNTIDVTHEGREYAVDTGFIVFNDRTYPNFVALLDELGIESQPSDMSFSVVNEATGLQYNGTNLNGLFADRLNLLRPSFHRMIRDILRFNREAPGVLEPGAPQRSLGEYLDSRGYSTELADNYVIPMGAAIWSASPRQMRRMPAEFFVRFFANHGLLSVDDHPAWRVIRGGSRAYVEKLVAGHRDRIHLGAAVERVRRHPTHVEVKVRGHEPCRFDAAFIACHSDQALAMLADPSALERGVLGAIDYQPNDAVLHTDAALMPRRRRAWAAWNYRVAGHDAERAMVTYHMNALQGLHAPVPFCVTLNDTARIDPASIVERVRYEHPVFTREAVAAQQRHADVNGVERTWYCGAYWRFGFHEDGVVSALNALEHFEQWRRDAQRNLRRTA